MEQIAISWEPERRTYTVAELNARIRGLFDAELRDVWVAGEISGAKTPGSGHCYFTLKDRESQIQCVCYKSALRYLKFKPQDGIAVLARGRVDVYEARGQYQLLVETLEPQGHGALQFAFEQLKKKLAAEGLFDQARKRPLPKHPRRIGIVTSPTGAVIRDIVQILSRRFPGLHIRLYPAQVQGQGSVEAVCRAIDYFSESGWPEILIVARGGGSLEDLWTFNEEAVARAIARCAVPVISAIGHETDFTIADFVSDLRAPTPSAAAELVIRSRQQLFDELSGFAQRLLQQARYRLALAGKRLHQQGIDRASSMVQRKIGRAFQQMDELEYALRDRVRLALAGRAEMLDRQTARLRGLDLRLRFAAARRRLQAADAASERHLRFTLTRAHRRLEPLSAHLTQLSPLKILERGYAIVHNQAGAVVKRPEDAAAGSEIRVRLGQGNLQATVK